MMPSGCISEMDSFDATVLVGFSVKISRSDGRVHPANVKSVDLSKCSVMVEWHEKTGETRGKEIEINDLWLLNQELLEYMKSTISERKTERRLRPSRLPARASASPAAVSSPVPVESVSVKTAARQTGVFRVPAPVPEPAAPQPEPVYAAPLPKATAAAGPRRSQRKADSRMTMAPAALPRIGEDFKENEAKPSLPVISAALPCRKKTAPPLEPSKANKRVSHVIKPPADAHNKKGKFGDPDKPRRQFSQMIEEFRETLATVPLSLSDPNEAHRICVCVRKRPLNKQEVSRKEIDVVSIPGDGALLVHEPKTKVDLTRYLENQVFHFDYSFDDSSTNELVYRFSAKPLVRTVFEGGMATCFAYGQTGSGKTHTMGGEFTKKSQGAPKGLNGEFSGKSQNSAEGIYGLAAQDVFTMLGQSRYSAMNLSPYVSFFEIYNGKVYDLLNKKALLRVLEDERQQVQVVGLQEVDVACPDDVIRLIQTGSACRTSGQTSANANSSRSHAILQVILRRRNNKLHGKFSLVDLAGNERGTDVSTNDKSTLVETSEINRSLLALKECIRSLGQNSDHIPFRMSKLTQVLRDSFIGENSRTCMIAMVSPGMASCDYTLNTLRYADRVKELNGSSKASEGYVPKGEEQEEEEEEEEEEESMESTSSGEENTLMHMPMPSIYEAISQMAEMAETLQKRAVELLGPMGRRWSDLKEGSSEMLEHITMLQAMGRALESTVDQEMRFGRVDS